MKLRYMIIGAGGVGGPVGAYLSKSGADTTLIARGKHLAVLQEHGLTLVSGENERESIPVKAIDMDGFLAAREQGAPAPDVIFVCVKGYSLADTVPFIRKAAGRDTVVIPVLNIYGTGRALQAELPELLVTDGCIYISANRIARTTALRPYISAKFSIRPCTPARMTARLPWLRTRWQNIHPSQPSLTCTATRS